MRFASFMVALLLASNVYAEDAHRVVAQKIAEDVKAQAIVYLGVGYICQDALGISFLNAANQIAVHAFTILGPMGSPQAVRDLRDRATSIVDEQLKIIRREQKKLPASAAEFCLEQSQEAQKELDLSLSKFRMATGR